MAEHKTDLELARERYALHKRLMQTEADKRGAGVGSERLTVYGIGFGSAAVELFMAGLEEYLSAAAADRVSAQKDRESAKLDREDQKRVRWGMGILTVAIVVVGVLGYLKPPTPIVVPAPVINVAAPPPTVVNIAPIPVTLTAPEPAAHGTRSLPK
jgi:hypothetical protein